MTWYQYAASGSVSTLNGMKTFGQDGRLIERHLRTTNVLWADGHVKAMKVQEIAKTKTLKTPNGTDREVHYYWTRQDD